MITALRQRGYAWFAGNSHLAWFSASSLALNLSAVAGGILVLRWVPPELMGIWQLMVVTEGYVAALRLGIPNAMNRELPYFLGRGDEAFGRDIAATSLLHALSAGSLVLVGFVVAGLYVDSPHWRAAVLARGIIAGTGFYQAYLAGTFRSNTSFLLLARIQFIQAGVALLMPVFAWLWGFQGLCAHAALQAVGILGVAHAWRPFRISPRFRARAAALLLRTGAHLFVTATLLIVIRSLDSLFLAWRGDLRDVGLFAPPLAVVHAMEVLPAAIASYAYPRMSYKLGRTDDAGSLRAITFRTVLLSLILCVPLVASGYIGLPAILDRFAPQYAASAAPMRIALFTGLMLASLTGTTVLRALKRWSLLYGFLFVMLISKLAFLLLLVTDEDPVIGAAWAGLAASLCAALAGAVACWIATRAPAMEPVQ